MKVFVVIVDDEPAVVKWFSSQVDWADFGCEVIGYFHKAADALYCLERNPVDLLITDICMPDLDGLVLISKAKQINPQMSIIVISAHSSFSYAKEAIRCGVDNYLIKPIDQDELTVSLRTVRENLNERQSGQDIDLFRKSVISSWLNHTYNSYTLKSQAQVAEVNLDAPFYRVAMIHKTDYAAPERKNLIAKSRLFFSKNGLDAYCLEDANKNMTFILGGSITDWRYRLNLYHRYLHQEYGKDIKIVVGTVEDQFSLVNNSYKLARRYLDVTIMTAISVLFCEDYEEIICPDLSGAIQSFRQMIIQKQTDKVQQIVKDQLGTCIQYSRCKKTAIVFASHLLEAMALGEKRLYSGMLDSMLLQFRVMQTIEDIIDWFAKLIDVLHQYLLEQHNEYHAHVRFSINVIHETYANQHLSLTDIANELDINAAYLGQLFKSQTGKYFNEYLAEVRLNSVISYLNESSHSIGEIVAKTGFTSQSYLNRLFKKHFKLTPNAYRQLFCKQDRSV